MNKQSKACSFAGTDQPHTAGQSESERTDSLVTSLSPGALSGTQSVSSPRLDVLLYAHDGRGHGHVSRAVAIGLALRRLAPQARVMLVTGAANVDQLELVGEIDWIKLPSRRAVVNPGHVQEGPGASNFTGDDLTSIRGAMLADLVRRLAPRCVLVDHLPLGKDSELVPAMRAAGDGVWLLGLRAILGDVKGLRSGEAARAVKECYQDVLWYGDPELHGTATPKAVTDLFDRSVLPCGLVSRAHELAYRLPMLREKSTSPVGTVSVPWCGPDTAAAMSGLAQALRELHDSGMEWHVYIGPSRSRFNRADIAQLFDGVPGCTTRDFGTDYLCSLRRSRVAVVYAGYNSITDTLWAAVPTILISHTTDELEQDEQARVMTRRSEQYVSLRNDEATAARWVGLLTGRMQYTPTTPPTLNGAERAARHVLASITDGSQRKLAR